MDDIKNYVLQRVMQVTGWQRDKAIVWYRTKSPRLGNTSPCHLVMLGKEDKVLKFLETCSKESFEL